MMYDRWGYDHFDHPNMRRMHDEARYPFDAAGERRAKGSHPYSYDPFFLFGSRADVKAATDGLYSDRIFQWDREKAERCWKEHIGRKRWDQASHRELDAFLSAYLSKKVRVTALAEGCNVSNGYPYWIVWFKDRAPKAAG